MVSIGIDDPSFYGFVYKVGPVMDILDDTTSIEESHPLN